MTGLRHTTRAALQQRLMTVESVVVAHCDRVRSPEDNNKLQCARGNFN